MRPGKHLKYHSSVTEKTFIRYHLYTVAFVFVFSVCNAHTYGQSNSFQFETVFSTNSDYILYYSTDKQNKFKTVHTSVFEFNLSEGSVKHVIGNNLDKKKPWLLAVCNIEQEEIEKIEEIPFVRKLPNTLKKYYKSLRNKPIVTLYFKSPSKEVYIQWEGSKPPNKPVVQHLLKLNKYFTELVRLKMNTELN